MWSWRRSTGSERCSILLSSPTGRCCLLLPLKLAAAWLLLAAVVWKVVAPAPLMRAARRLKGQAAQGQLCLEEPGSHTVHCCPRRRFADGFPNLFVKDAIRIRNRHVAFLASFHSPEVIFEQASKGAEAYGLQQRLVKTRGAEGMIFSKD